jgi:hypothetical protein
MPDETFEHEPLQAGLWAAFGRDSGALATLERSGSSCPRILLREEPDEPTGLVAPATLEASAASGMLGRYRVDGELARGGIGVILRGRDPDLGRDIALKRLRAEHAGDPLMIRRLVEEAQIGGQLQHPGILPVHELGVDAELRPFFAMKLVRGRALSALLQERPDPSHDRRRFLAIFEAVCQAVAYAHARGVIHRDLKPANVLVGSFGEVQVVDWGLAKVLARQGSGTDHRASGTGSMAEAVVQTARSGSGADASAAGSVLGTPAYIPPEQARGEIDRLDERADVFALGALLCEILTGRPPFGPTRAGALRQSAEGQLGAVYERLEGCGVDAELVALARRCLSVEPEDRPRDASAVARAVTAYLTSVEERAHAAELAAVEARAAARAERRIRRLALALAAVLLLLGVSEAGLARVEQARRAQAERLARAEQDRREQMEKALRVVIASQGKSRWALLEAGNAPDAEAGLWAQFLHQVRLVAEQVAASAPNAAERERTEQLIDELAQREAELRRRAQETPLRGVGR